MVAVAVAFFAVDEIGAFGAGGAVSVVEDQFPAADDWVVAVLSVGGMRCQPS